MSERIKVIEKPRGAALYTAAGYKNTVAGFEVECGIMAFDPDASDLPKRQLWTLVMASLAMPNPRIAQKLKLSEQSVQGSIRNGMDHPGVPHRSGLARYFMSQGVYKLVQAANELGLSDCERKVLEQVSLGQTNDEAAAALSLAPATIKSHMTRMAVRTGLRSREELALRTIASQEVGNYALHDINLQSPESWSQQGQLLVPNPAPLAVVGGPEHE